MLITSTKRTSSARVRAGLLGLGLALLPLLGWGQINLTNSGVYSQDFDGLGGGLPAGITVVTGATASNLGTAATLVAAGTAANNTSGNFRNVISATGYTSGTYPLAATTTAGAGFTNRALALRQTGAFGDPGGAFVFQLANTTGFTGFQASFQLQSLDAGSARTTTFRVDYGMGSAPTTFSLAALPTGALTTGGTTFGSSPVNIDFGAALDNQVGPVYIRIVALTVSAGSNNRATSAIDDFTLTYTPGAPSPTLVANPAALSGFAATPPTASAAQSFTVSGTNLTPANATVTVGWPGAPDYEVSIDNTNFLGAGNTFPFNAAGGTLASQTLYVRLKAGLAAGSYNGQILTVSGGGPSQTVTLNGTAGGAPATYTWDGSTSSSFKEPTNWTPDRNTLASNDILVFDRNATPTATVSMDFGGSNQDVGQLIFRNGIVATLLGSANRILTLNGPASPANLLLSAADSVILNNPSGNVLTIVLATGAKGQIDGKVLAIGDLGSFAALRSADTGAIVLRAGSRFNAGSAALGFTGAAFVSATAGSVVFQPGAYYAQYGGSNPFGTNNNAVFQAGSYYRFNNLTTGAPSLSGRTYGYLIYNAGFTTATIPTPGGSGLTIQNDLVVNSGNLEINLNAASNFQGSIVANGTGAVAFTSRSPGGVPSGINVVNLNGPAAQLIGGNSPAAAAISFADNTTLQINNPGAGVTLGRPLTLPGTLTLASGLLNTDATNILTLGAGANVSAGAATTYVNGPLQWTIFTTNSGPGIAYFFPIGKGGQYRPLTLRVNALTAVGGNYFRAEQVEGDPGGGRANPDPSGANLARVSPIRYFDVTPYQDAAGAVPLPNPPNFIGTVTLSFGPDDGVNVPNDPGLVVAKRSFDYGLSTFEEWRNFGRSSSTGGAGSGPGGPGVAGTITSNNINSFSQLTLGATNALTFVNPLPVQLTGFAAARAGGAGVRVHWATASEVNSARFEVERSVDGLIFKTVATVAAAGSSAQARSYAALDAGAPATALYYRLRQVDRDGAAHYSAVVWVAAGAAAAPTLALYPNPAQDAVHLLGGAPAPGATCPFVVRSALGQVLLRGIIPAAPSPISVAGLPAGLYFLELQTAAGPVVRRFGKE